MTEIRLSLIGNGGVGKSSITIQFVSNHFVDEYDPTIEDSYRKRINFDNEVILFDILDSNVCTKEGMSQMFEEYARNSQGFLVVFSLTDRQSFEDVNNHIASINLRKDGEANIVLCGNKSDLFSERTVRESEAVAMAQKFSIPYFEVSAKTRSNIEEIFSEIGRMVKYKKINIYIIYLLIFLFQNQI